VEKSVKTYSDYLSLFSLKLVGPFRKSFKIFVDSHRKRLSVKFCNLLLLPRLAFNYLLFLIIITWLSSPRIIVSSIAFSQFLGLGKQKCLALLFPYDIFLFLLNIIIVPITPTKKPTGQAKIAIRKNITSKAFIR